MANEIYFSIDEAEILYALVWKKTDDKVFDESDGGDTFETYTDANIANYNIPMAKQADSDYYTVDFPTVIATSGVYRVQVFKQDSAVADTPHADNDRVVGQGEIAWTGSAESDVYTLYLTQSKVLNVYDETGTTPSLEVIVE